MDAKSINLGKVEIMLLSSLEHDKKTLFSFQDALKRIPNSSRPVIRNTLSRLVKKGRVKRLKKGEYILVPFRLKDWSENELSLVSFLSKEGYVSFWSALSFWSLTEQLPRQIYVAAKYTIKDRAFEEVKYKFVKLSKRYFFGFTEADIGGRKVYIATKEKAILDCILHPEYCGGLGEVAKALRDNWKELDWKKFSEYLNQMNNSAVERRLHYLADLLKLAKVQKAICKKKFVGIRVLDSSKPKTGEYNYKFGLMINTNVSEEML
jgi:predicted transcriptional regulator of viral defense system